MPELPEAEITRRNLKPLLGKKIAGFWSNWPRALRITASRRKINSDIKGRVILDIRRHGKAIFLGLSSKEPKSHNTERLLVFHQRMSGSLLIKPKTQIMQGKTAHIHAKIFFEDESELWFEDPRKFGVIWYGKLEEVRAEKYIASLGPDALKINFEEFLSRFRKHKGIIKPVLLRQDVLAGIGNIVADESLWRSKIHPRTPVARLPDSKLRKLFQSVKKVLETSIKAKGTTLRNWKGPDSERGGFQKYLKVYGRKNSRCYRCRSLILRLVVANRGTWICPECQKI